MQSRIKYHGSPRGLKRSMNAWSDMCHANIVMFNIFNLVTVTYGWREFHRCKWIVRNDSSLFKDPINCGLALLVQCSRQARCGAQWWAARV